MKFRVGKFRRYGAKWGQLIGRPNPGLSDFFLKFVPTLQSCVKISLFFKKALQICSTRIDHHN